MARPWSARCYGVARQREGSRQNSTGCWFSLSLGSLETMLVNYRDSLLAKNEAGQTVDSAGPIVLGTRLESSQEPRAWRTITYSKGSWIMQMLRGRLGDDRFLALLAEIMKRYDHKDIKTWKQRNLAAEFLPAKSDDPKL